MKKFILLLTFAIFTTIPTMAEVMWYKTTEFAMRLKLDGSWQEWTDWETSRLDVKIDTDELKIVVYSETIQIYKILEQVDPPYDSSGKQIKFRVVDQDRDLGYIRLRVENSGNSQLYVDFSNVSWVYNIVRVN